MLGSPRLFSPEMLEQDDGQLRNLKVVTRGWNNFLLQDWGKLWRQTPATFLCPRYTNRFCKRVWVGVLVCNSTGGGQRGVWVFWGLGFWRGRGENGGGGGMRSWGWWWHREEDEEMTLGRGEREREREKKKMKDDEEEAQWLSEGWRRRSTVKKKDYFAILPTIVSHWLVYVAL